MFVLYNLSYLELCTNSVGAFLRTSWHAATIGLVTIEFVIMTIGLSGYRLDLVFGTIHRSYQCRDLYI